MISLLLNVALLAAAGFLFRKPTPSPVERVVTKTVVTNGTALEAATNIAAQVVEVKTNAPFDWSMVASAELEAFVKNLRAISCPEDTIRDIITAEVDEIFLKKIAERLDPLKHGFWFILANWKTQEKETEAKMKGVEKVGKERDEMLKKLLSADTDAIADARPRSDQSQEKMSFLPKEKQEQMIALSKSYNEERMRIQKEADGKPLTKEKLKRVDELRKKTDDERKALMTPAEFEEFQLRGGNFTQFRYNVAMPDFTEEQTRAMAKAHMEIDQSQPPEPGNSSDPNYGKIQLARKTALNEKLKTTLGEELYSEYKRAEDGNFQQVYRVTERYELPRETAVKVYDLQQSATKQRKEVFKDKTLSDDERSTLLSVLQQQTQRNVTQSLGDNAAKTYQKYGGDWVNSLDDE